MGIFRKWYLYFRAIPKTIYFNFSYFPLFQAIKLPILVSHRVWLKKTQGQVVINGTIETGLIKIGFGSVGIFDASMSRTIWEVSGKVTFQGKADIGHGSKICVKGHLDLGKNFKISAESALICSKMIKFGNDCLMSWDCLVMDTDFHKIKDKNNIMLNSNKKIIIGDNVWIGCRCLILKGSSLQNDCVIAAGTTIRESINSSNVIIGGNPVRVLKENIYWE